MSKNSDAPWILEFDGEIKSRYFTVGAVNIIPAPQYGIGRDECEANAKLIAAAPDLLAACELARKQLGDLRDVMYGQNMTVNGWHQNGNTETLDSFFDENDFGAIESLDTAIAKAKGGE